MRLTEKTLRALVEEFGASMDDQHGIELEWPEACHRLAEKYHLTQKQLDCVIVAYEE
jgi:hypothetical protein